MLLEKTIFDEAAERLHKEYTAQIKKLVKKGDDYLDAAENLERRRDELCEYIRNTSNIQLLENYLHYFYQDTEYLWEYMSEGTIVIDDPDRICEFLDTRTKEIKDDFEILLERGQLVPKDMELAGGKDDFLKIYEQDTVYVLTPFTKTIKGVEELAGVHHVQCSQMVSFNGRMDILETELKAFAKKGYEIHSLLS
jgi:transcription-repair coupling factor (superfamily II helicase)